jgi:hypothetical protein
MKLKLLLTAFTMALLTACMQQAPTMTPLEIQSMQTRSFNATYNVTFSSTMSVFQDLGYTVNSADKDTGLISAESATDSSAAALFWTGTSVTNQTKATAFIEKIRGKTLVRLNFVQKVETSSGYGRQDRNDKPILDTQIYQNAFERIENAIFLRK